MPIRISAATEGYPDEVVVKVLCRTCGIEVKNIFNCRGKINLDRKISGYNQAAQHWFWLVLRDLDHDAPCGPDLARSLLPEPAKFMHLRIVVREIESWLMGDRESFSSFFRVPSRIMPTDVESLENPKEELIRLVSRSKSADLKRDMIPRPNSGAKIGPGYPSQLALFAQRHWRPLVAAEVCRSLRGCINRLADWSRLEEGAHF